jgi:hypothetical protein
MRVKVCRRAAQRAEGAEGKDAIDAILVRKAARTTLRFRWRESLKLPPQSLAPEALTLTWEQVPYHSTKNTGLTFNAGKRKVTQRLPVTLQISRTCR